MFCETDVNVFLMELNLIQEHRKDEGEIENKSLNHKFLTTRYGVPAHFCFIRKLYPKEGNMRREGDIFSFNAEFTHDKRLME